MRRGGRITWCISTGTAPSSTWPILASHRRAGTGGREVRWWWRSAAAVAADVRDLGRRAGACGQHGYLLFEDPDSEENQQLVDGPALGRLLTGTGVPVLVLNACRSAYTEARDQPGDARAPARTDRAGPRAAGRRAA